MRIAQISRAVYPLHGFGGLEQHVYQLSRHLARLGVEVTVITSPPSVEQAGAAGLSPSIGDNVRAVPVRSRRVPLRLNSVPDRLVNYPWFTLACGRLAAAMGSAGHIDVVHAHGLCAFGYGLEASRARTVPMLANPHGMEEFKVADPLKRAAYAPFRLMYRAGARKASRVVATDDSMAAEVEKFLGVDGKQVVMLPNAIDPDECDGYVSADESRRTIEACGLGGSGPILLSVGRIEANKGYPVLLDALRRVADDLPAGWVWVVAGDGSQRSVLEGEIERAGLAQRIRLLGKVSNTTLHNLYAVADMFVHPTLYEGSSIVTLEAMVHGLPVVASAVGGIPDKITPGLNGYLCPPGDPDALARQLRRLVGTPATWQQMGEEGARIARARFSWEKVARDTLSIYEKMLAEGGRWERNR